MKHPRYCHLCPHNGKGQQECLDCQLEDETNFNLCKDRYILEGYEPREDDVLHGKPSEKVTKLSDEVEDKLRFALIQIFKDLTPLQILVLGMIMSEKYSLTEIGRELKSIVNSIKDSKTISRHRIFQTRKRIVRRLPFLKDVLITKGQRRSLK